MTSSPGTRTLDPPTETTDPMPPGDPGPPPREAPVAPSAPSTAAAAAAPRPVAERRQTARAKRDGMSHAMRVTLTVGGVLLVLVGIAGLVLPGIQGVVTILAGLALLSLVSRGIRGWTYRALGRWPTMRRRVERFRRRMERRVGGRGRGPTNAPPAG